jgi:hypothetical protein
MPAMDIKTKERRTDFMFDYFFVDKDNRITKMEEMSLIN